MKMNIITRRDQRDN